MSSAISCIVIKSDGLARKIPEVGEIVRIHGRFGLFTVVSVDKHHRSAQLMARSGQHRLEDVSFSEIRAIDRSLAHTIRRFLDAQDEPHDLL